MEILPHPIINETSNNAPNLVHFLVMEWKGSLDVLMVESYVRIKEKMD